MSAIPDDELNILVNTVDEAVSLASSGRVADGFRELEYGLERAQAAREGGNKARGR